MHAVVFVFLSLQLLCHHGVGWFAESAHDPPIMHTVSVLRGGFSGSLRSAAALPQPLPQAGMADTGDLSLSVVDAAGSCSILDVMPSLGSLADEEVHDS
jgi:hypothetical protein